MTDLPKALREALAAGSDLTTLDRASEQVSSDGTIKWAWRTADGKLVESVYMPETDRKTLCVSSQVGCAIGCTFCMTGTMGLVRHLTAGENVDQIHRANRRIVELGGGPAPRPLTNLVFMGMGSRSTTTRRSPPRWPAARRRCRSTGTSPSPPAAWCPRAAARPGDPGQAGGLAQRHHRRGRERLMPINRRYPFRSSWAACRFPRPMKKRRRITCEYVLLDGVNDSDEDASRWPGSLRELAFKVNLIAYNAQDPGLGFQAPAARVEAFHQRLCDRLITAVSAPRTAAATSRPPAASWWRRGGRGDPRRGAAAP